MRQYEYSPLVWAGWSEGHGYALIHTVVFENYPAVRSKSTEPEEDLEIVALALQDELSPRNVIGSGSELVIGINYDCCRFDAATITGILRFEILLQGHSN